MFEDQQQLVKEIIEADESGEFDRLLAYHGRLKREIKEKQNGLPDYTLRRMKAEKLQVKDRLYVLRDEYIAALDDR